GGIVSASQADFGKAMDTLGGLVGMLQGTVERLKERPSKVEIEFGASLTADCNLWIVSGEGKAEFKVKLAWEDKVPKPAA
ncbi:MAG: CU044_2847 family protein, partial [Beijerinckiaceae bacterium]